MEQEIKWHFNENGKDIEVPLEDWVWHVVYTDGTELYQFGREVEADGKRRFHQFAEIDQSRVKVFEMMSTKDTGLRYSIDVTEETDRLIHFYRCSRVEIGTPREQKLTFYCFGYKLKGLDEVSLYHFILPDNRLVVTTNRDVGLL